MSRISSLEKIGKNRVEIRAQITRQKLAKASKPESLVANWQHCKADAGVHRKYQGNQGQDVGFKPKEQPREAKSRAAGIRMSVK